MSKPTTTTNEPEAIVVFDPCLRSIDDLAQDWFDFVSGLLPDDVAARFDAELDEPDAQEFASDIINDIDDALFAAGYLVISDDPNAWFVYGPGVEYDADADTVRFAS